MARRTKKSDLARGKAPKPQKPGIPPVNKPASPSDLFVRVRKEFASPLEDVEKEERMRGRAATVNHVIDAFLRARAILLPIARVEERSVTWLLERAVLQFVEQRRDDGDPASRNDSLFRNR